MTTLVSSRKNHSHTSNPHSNRSQSNLSSQVNEENEEISPDSDFQEMLCEFNLHLHPKMLGSIQEGIQDQLNQYILAYVPDVEGVVLSYSNVLLKESVGRIFFERPYINFRVTALLLVFAVRVGKVMRGVVNKVGPDHLSLLVHGGFACAIPHTSIPPFYLYRTIRKESTGKNEEMMIDTRMTEGNNNSTMTSTPATPSTNTAGMSKNAVKKQQKKLEKEERRKAYIQSTGKDQPKMEGKYDDDNDEEDNEGSENQMNVSEKMKYNIRVGSEIQFEVTALHHTADYFSLSGSFTRPNTYLIPGTLIVLPAWRARKEAEEREERKRKEAEENDVERIFSAPAESQEEIRMDPDQDIPTQFQPQTLKDPNHISKKELKAMKKQEKAHKKAEKQLKKAEKRKEKEEGVYRDNKSNLVKPVKSENYLQTPQSRTISHSASSSPSSSYDSSPIVTAYSASAAVLPAAPKQLQRISSPSLSNSSFLSTPVATSDFHLHSLSNIQTDITPDKSKKDKKGEKSSHQLIPDSNGKHFSSTRIPSTSKHRLNDDNDSSRKKFKISESPVL